MPTNILNLKSFTVTKVSEQENDYRIDAEVAFPTPCCMYCGGSVVGFGRHMEVIMDTPIHGKRVGIWVNRRRFRCSTCMVTFYESIPAKDGKRQVTSRLIAYIEKQSLVRPFAQIADEVGLDEKTIRNIFNDYIEKMESTINFETPRVMGIDEIHIISKPRCVITNIEQQTLVDMLVNRNKPTVAKYLSELKNRDHVQLVAMDMWRPYRDAVKACLPGATVVIDKFHIVRMANAAMESARKSVRARLTTKQRRGLMRDRYVLLRRNRELTMPELIAFESWTRNYPEIGEAYRLKESFYEIWEKSETRDQAERAINVWEQDISPEVLDHFKPLLISISNWREEIFAYFDHPITNAYTESLNNLIRFINRAGRGYSFDALRAKVLFTHGFHKKQTKKSSYQRDPNAWGLITGWEKSAGHESINYGSSISTLVTLLRDKAF